MSTLYIRLPSRSAADHALHWSDLPCPFAMADGSGPVHRQGVQPLSSLSSEVAQARRVVLILAASDVSLLRVQVPPMSAARLKAALPNLVEDQLISDPADSVMVASPAGQTRTVAVVHRAWLDVLARSLGAWGARTLLAIPAQLCLPVSDDRASAAVTLHDADLDLALRLGPGEGLGLPVFANSAAEAPAEVVAALRTLVPHAPVTLQVPAEQVDAWQEQIARSTDGQRIDVQADDWSHWIAQASQPDVLNLMAAMSPAKASAFPWRAWRLPLALAVTLLLVNLVALQIDWWRLRTQADAQRSAMMQIFRSAYPREPVVLDPLAQMRQKAAAARRDAGEVGPDDFLALSARFGQAWAERAGNQPLIAALDYREQTLNVRFKPDTRPPENEMKTALAARELALTPASGQGGVTTWQIRSKR